MESKYVREMRYDFTSLLLHRADEKVKQYLEVFPELDSRLCKFAIGILEWELGDMIELDNFDDICRLRTMLRVLDKTPGYDFFDAEFNGIEDPEVVWNIIGFPTYTEVVNPNEDIKFNYTIQHVDNCDVANLFLKAGPRGKDTFVDEETINAYYANGDKLFYCINHDWLQIKCVPGLNFPHDRYGYSLIAVEVTPKGEIASVTSRWNICGGDVGGFLSAEELKEILGDKYQELFQFVQSTENE